MFSRYKNSKLPKQWIGTVVMKNSHKLSATKHMCKVLLCMRFITRVLHSSSHGLQDSDRICQNFFRFSYFWLRKKFMDFSKGLLQNNKSCNDIKNPNNRTKKKKKKIEVSQVTISITIHKHLENNSFQTKYITGTKFCIITFSFKNFHYII